VGADALIEDPPGSGERAGEADVDLVAPEQAADAVQLGRRAEYGHRVRPEGQYRRSDHRPATRWTGGVDHVHAAGQPEPAPRAAEDRHIHRAQPVRTALCGRDDSILASGDGIDPGQVNHAGQVGASQVLSKPLWITLWTTPG